MEERVKALDAFLKSEISEIDRSLSFAENLDKMYTKMGLDPIKRKFWVDFHCGITPEIENEEALRDEILFYSKFRLFESKQRFRIAFGLEPLYSTKAALRYHGSTVGRSRKSLELERNATWSVQVLRH